MHLHLFMQLKYPHAFVMQSRMLIQSVSYMLSLQENEQMKRLLCPNVIHMFYGKKLFSLHATNKELLNG